MRVLVCALALLATMSVGRTAFAEDDDDGDRRPRSEASRREGDRPAPPWMRGGPSRPGFGGFGGPRFSGPPLGRAGGPRDDRGDRDDRDRPANRRDDDDDRRPSFGRSGGRPGFGGPPMSRGGRGFGSGPGDDRGVQELKRQVDRLQREVDELKRELRRR